MSEPTHKTLRKQCWIQAMVAHVGRSERHYSADTIACADRMLAAFDERFPASGPVGPMPAPPEQPPSVP